MGAGNRDRSQQRPVPTFDHLAKKTPLELREWIPLDGSASEAFEEAKREYQAAELTDPTNKEGRLKAARDKYDAAKEALLDNSVEMVFRSIGRPAYDALLKKHPPTEKQVEEHKKEHGFAPEYNAETFAPELIAASCVQPEMTAAQVLSLIEDYGWNAGEYSHLFQLAVRVNTSRRVADLAF